MISAETGRLRAASLGPPKTGRRRGFSVFISSIMSKLECPLLGGAGEKPLAGTWTKLPGDSARDRFLPSLSKILEYLGGSPTMVPSVTD